jgi:DNA polymerase-4
MNAFFASCHQAQNPELRNRPVLVAGDPRKRHGIILTASYEARASGVRTAMPVWQAKKLCPDGLFIRPDHRLYLDYSRRILTILLRYTPLVEPYSIDEAWLDVTGSRRLFGRAEEIGLKLQQRIAEELNLTCSVGVSSNKFLAKMASERQKPRGFTVIYPEHVESMLWPLPVGEMVGVGRKTIPVLHEMGITTIGRLAAMPVRLLSSRFGVMGEVLHRLAQGQDDSPVDPSSLESVKSVGHSVTLPRDICDPLEVDTVLLDLSEKVARRLRRGGCLARTVTLTVRDHNFVDITRARTLGEPTWLAEVIYRTARDIHRHSFEPWRKVRLLGVTASNLTDAWEGRQLSLFGTDNERLERLTKAVDRLKDRFGEESVQRARLCRGDKENNSK